MVSKQGFGVLSLGIDLELMMSKLYPGRFRLLSSYLGMYFRKSGVILRNFFMRVEAV